MVPSARRRPLPEAVAEAIKVPDLPKNICAVCAGPEACPLHHPTNEVENTYRRTIQVTATPRGLRMMFANAKYECFGVVEAIRWVLKYESAAMSDAWITYATLESAMDALGRAEGNMEPHERAVALQDVWPPGFAVNPFPIKVAGTRRKFLQQAPLAFTKDAFAQMIMPSIVTVNGQQTIHPEGAGAIFQRTVHLTGEADDVELAINRFSFGRHGAVEEVRIQGKHAFVTFANIEAANSSLGLKQNALDGPRSKGQPRNKVKGVINDSWGGVRVEKFPMSGHAPLNVYYNIAPMSRAELEAGIERNLLDRDAAIRRRNRSSTSKSKSSATPSLQIQDEAPEDGELEDGPTSPVPLQGSKASFDGTISQPTTTAPSERQLEIPEEGELRDESYPPSAVPSYSASDSHKRANGKRRADDDVDSQRPVKRLVTVAGPTFTVGAETRLPTSFPTIEHDPILAGTSFRVGPETRLPTSYSKASAESAAAAAQLQDFMFRSAVDVALVTSRRMLEEVDVKWTPDVAVRARDISLALIRASMDTDEAQRTADLTARADEFQRLMSEKETAKVGLEAELDRERREWESERAAFERDRAAWKMEEVRLRAVVAESLPLSGQASSHASQVPWPAEAIIKSEPEP